MNLTTILPSMKRSPVMLPIPGTSRVTHLEENVAGAAVALTDEEFAELDAASSRSLTINRTAAE